MASGSTSKDSAQPFLDLGLTPDVTERLLQLFTETFEEALRKVRTGIPGSFSPTTLSKVNEASSASESHGTELKPQNKIKAADLRVALLLGKVPENAGILVDITQFAKLLSISSKHLRRLLDLKAIPQPVHLGRLMRWRLTEVLEWIEEDCPLQKVWAIKKQEVPGRRQK